MVSPNPRGRADRPRGHHRHGDADDGTDQQALVPPSPREMTYVPASTPAPGEDADAGAGFDQFYRDNVDGLFRYLAYGQRLGEAQARDSAQEAFLVMLRLWPRWRDKPDEENIAYLFRIAINKSRWLRRKDQAATGADAQHLPDWADPTTGSAPSPETTAIAWTSFEQLLTWLPAQQRKVLALNSCGLSGPQIAEILGVSLGTVHSTAKAARDKLRTLIDKEGHQ